MSIRERLLIGRLRDRDERAFREVVTEYHQRVYSLTFRMLGNAQEAEDVAQEVFITVFKSIDQFRGESKFSTWLYRIVANHCKNRIKYLARRHDRMQDEYDDAEFGQVNLAANLTAQQERNRPDKRLEGAELEKLMQEAIRELDEEQRLLVVLRDVEDLSYEEICQITELPEGTVKSRLHRARMALRKKLLRHLS